MKYFAGIGSRKTPEPILKEMTRLSGILESRGYILRSGGAIGADTAFSDGTNNAQIWYADESHVNGKNTYHDYRVLDNWDISAYSSVQFYHPKFKKLSESAIKLHARNYRQIIGWNEPNSLFVVCWTEDGEEKGGTAQALRIAKDYGIPIFNYFNLSTEEILKEIDKLEMLYD